MTRHGQIYDWDLNQTSNLHAGEITSRLAVKKFVFTVIFVDWFNADKCWEMLLDKDKTSVQFAAGTFADAAIMATEWLGKRKEPEPRLVVRGIQVGGQIEV